MTQNPPDTTIGLLESSERLLNWSSSVGLKPTCALLLSALQQETAPADYLGTVLTRIRLSAKLLRSWSAAGDELYGLARLATVLENDPNLIDALGAGTRAIARDALKDFRGSSNTHYLYVACVARDPVDIPEVRILIRLRLICGCINRAMWIGWRMSTVKSPGRSCKKPIAPICMCSPALALTFMN